MRVLVMALFLALSVGIAQANDFFQSSNPFPEQTGQPEYKNIYATEPQAEVKEQMTSKKMGFWNRIKCSEKTVQPEKSPVNEGIKGTPDGSFYVFPSK